MNEQTVRKVREGRAYLRACDDGTTYSIIGLMAVIILLILAFSLGTVIRGELAFCYGLGAAVSFVVWSMLIIYSRRAWLMARAAFEVASDGIETELSPVQDVEPAPSVPEPKPNPEPEPMARISADTALKQLLNDMPIEKLQAIIDARTLKVGS